MLDFTVIRQRESNGFLTNQEKCCGFIRRHTIRKTCTDIILHLPVSNHKRGKSVSSGDMMAKHIRHIIKEPDDNYSLLHIRMFLLQIFIACGTFSKRRPFGL